MPVLTKRVKASHALFDQAKEYSVEDAMEVLKKLPGAKFDETVDLSLRLGVDPKHSDPMGRGAVAEDLVEKVQGGWLEFDSAIATPDLMGQVGKLGKTLGPRGLMPNPKLGTVTFDVARAVREVKAGKVEFRVDKAGNVHVLIGKKSFSAEQLAANAMTLVEAIMRARPASAKGQYLKSLTVSSTMGPGIPVDVQRIANLFKK